FVAHGFDVHSNSPLLRTQDAVKHCVHPWTPADDGCHRAIHAHSVLRLAGGEHSIEPPDLQGIVATHLSDCDSEPLGWLKPIEIVLDLVRDRYAEAHVGLAGGELVAEAR